MLVMNKETALTVKAAQRINAATKGALMATAREKAATDTLEEVGAALATAIRIVYAPAVLLAPPPVVTMLNAFMRKIDWTVVAEKIVIRPEDN
jgi:hypothetical protein